METKRNHRLLLLLTLCSLLFSQTGAWVPSRDPSGAGNDVLEDQGPVKRHSDAVFTDNYTRLLREQARKKYLNSVLRGKPRKPIEGESESQ